MRIASLFFVLFLSSQMPCSAEEAPWSAQSIGMADHQAPNTWFCYRTTFDLPEIPASALARIACDSRYWLWVNGAQVVFDGQLKRGPTPEDTYYDVVDILPQLDKGRNSIAVLMWYWGKHGFSHNNSGKAGLVFEADLGASTLRSDASWKVMVHPAYGETRAPHPNYRLPEANIHFDARKDPGPWSDWDFDAASWATADEFGVPPVAPWNKLEARPILHWLDTGVIAYEDVRTETDEEGVTRVIGALPYNQHITPYLKVNAPAGKLIDIRTDNYRGGGTENVRAEYVTREGEQSYESLGWMNGHEVHYTIPEGVEVVHVGYRATGYNAEMTGSFNCDDPALNQLWEESKRTLYVTMRDNFMDCPDRERAQWWGDAVNEIGETFYVFDAERGPLLARKAMLELARWQKPDKTLYSPVPAGLPTEGKTKDGSYDRELPRQMLASVGWYGFWNYYVYTGDAETIRRVYPAVRDYLSLWKIGDDGLCVHRKGGWDWTDWGKHKDVPVIENAFLHLALKAASAMAELTGNSEDIPAYQEKMDSIAANFNRVLWQGDRYRSPGHKGETDDRAQAMAVVAGLADEAYYPAIRKVLAVEEHASPYMEKYVLEALFLMDAPGEALDRMKRRYAPMLADPWSTLWENFGAGDQPGSGTYNHAWSGGPLTALSQYAAGISPASPGFDAFEVRPQMGPLRAIDAVVPTKNGNIEMRIRRGDDTTRFTFQVPEGCSGTLHIPGAPKSVQVNGKPGAPVVPLTAGAWEIEASQ